MPVAILRCIPKQSLSTYAPEFKFDCRNIQVILLLELKLILNYVSIPKPSCRAICE